MDNNYLQHHGILGMKWGVRRYQNKDGSLTAAGRKRVAKLDAEREALTGKKSSSGDSAPKKRTIHDVPDDELRKMVERRRMENDYLSLTKHIQELTPKQVSNGKKVVDYMLNKVIVPAATDASKKFATSFLNAKGDELLSKLTTKAATGKK
jgi:hypothetical protein